MLLTIKELNIKFNQEIESMKNQLAELNKLEEAIEKSAHFKLLSGKTQMIGKGRGISKKERSRMVHTNLIAMITESAVKQIYDKFLKAYPDLNEKEYREMFELNREIEIRKAVIIAKAHDIGHVAFGHQGEQAINDFMSEIKDTAEIDAVLKEHYNYFGEDYERNQGHTTSGTTLYFSTLPRVQSLSFEHNELSAIIFNQIIEKENINLSKEDVKKLTLGVLGHSTSRTDISLLVGNLVAQIVRVMDKVEYINADWDEIRSLIKIPSNMEPDIALYLQNTMYERMNKTTEDLVEEAFRLGEINENHATMRRLSRMRKTYDDTIYLYDGTCSDKILSELLNISDDSEALQKYYDQHEGVEALYPAELVQILKQDREIVKNASKYDFLEVDDSYQRMLTEQVHFKGLMQGENSEIIYFMYQRLLNYYYKNSEKIPSTISRTINPIDIKQSEQFIYQLNPDYSKLQKSLEYISLMDDKSLEQEYNKLVEERITQGPGFGVEPITVEEMKTYLRRMFDEEAQKLVFKEKMGTRSYEEARILLSTKSNGFYSDSLTTIGKLAKQNAFEQRLKAYEKIREDEKRMIKFDEERRQKTKTTEKVVPSKANRAIKNPHLKQVLFRRRERDHR